MSDDFANWVNDLETQEQPNACTIDNPECDSCGS